MGRGPQKETLAVHSVEIERQPAPVSLPFARAAADGGVGGVRCVALGKVPIAIDTLTWRVGSTLRLTVVVKAQFSVEPMSSPEAEPVVPIPSPTAPRFYATDVHARNQPMAHVIAVSDRVPWKTKVDITLAGHCVPTGGQPVTESTVRFALVDGATTYIQKKARVLGKRLSAGDEPEPFVAMPLIYERAYGGPATPTNPIGTGDDEDDPPPNVLDPDNLWRPAAFGPIADGWPLRHRKLGNLKRKDLKEPILNLPQDFDVSYFQSAPADQQLASLGATARFVLEGFHAQHPKVEIALPKARLFGAMWGLSAESSNTAVPLAFHVDTVHLDADGWQCILIWRACVDLPDETALSRVILAVGMGLDGEVVALPEGPPDPESALVVGGLGGAVPERAPTGTLDVSSVVSARGSLPFGRKVVREQDATMALPSGEAAPPPLPFQKVAPAPKAPPVPKAAPKVAPVHPVAAAPAVSAVEPPPVVAVPAVEPPPVAAPLVAAPPVIRAEAPASTPVAIASTPAVAPGPAKDPYGQMAPWARGAEGGTEIAETAAAPPKPRAKPERKFNLRKSFQKR